MPKMPDPTPGKTRKRKRDKASSDSKEGRYSESRNKVISTEEKRPRSHDASSQDAGDKGGLEGGNRVINTNDSTILQESIPEGQLNHSIPDEVEEIYPTILPIFIASSSVPGGRNPLAEGGLCKPCTDIDLDTLLSRPHKTQAGQLAKKLSPALSWDDSCTLCRLFLSTMDPAWRKSTEKVPLRTYSSNKMEDKFWNLISTNLLHLGYWKYLVSQPEGTRGPVKIVKNEISSFECIKDWISLCSRQHKICNLKAGIHVPGQKLIDCETRALVSRQHQSYVALSYVWGRPSDISEDSFTLLAKLPNTIEDAITVTKRLGYRYLWVDRYCIDQENEQEKADQCGKMDLIYQNAELTIIAAIGENPNYGLPGVSLRKRSSIDLTTCAKIGKHFLISIEACPNLAVEGTTWNERAWTFQESLLSRRRLVFTKEQMYFECYGMYCCESLHLPLESMHRKDMQGFKSIYCSEQLVGIFPKGVGTTAMEIVKRIQEYTQRKLTNQSDILKGMLGIFHAFQESRLRIYHCGGIPLLPSKLGRSDGKPVEGWTPAMSFFKGLFWDLESPSNRRHGFPSWSWTGWHGPVKWGAEKHSFWQTIQIDPDVQVRVELLNGQLRALEESTHSNITGIVHITAWIIEIKILKNIYKEKEGECLARLELEDGGHLEWNFQSMSKAKVSPGETCKGIILGEDLDSPGMYPGHHIGPALLVCAEFDGTMERISISWIDSFTYNRYDENGVQESRHHQLSLEEHISGVPIPRPINPRFAAPPDLIKSWETIQLG